MLPSYLGQSEFVRGEADQSLVLPHDCSSMRATFAVISQQPPRCIAVLCAILLSWCSCDAAVYTFSDLLLDAPLPLVTSMFGPGDTPARGSPGNGDSSVTLNLNFVIADKSGVALPGDGMATMPLRIALMEKRDFDSLQKEPSEDGGEPFLMCCTEDRKLAGECNLERLVCEY